MSHLDKAMSHLANFVCERNSENVGQYRTRAGDSDMDVVLKYFGCKTVKIALSTSPLNIGNL